MISLSFPDTLMIRDRCLCLEAHRAARRLARRFDEVFRPLGLTHGQFSLLNGLNRPSPPLIREVASLLAMDRTTLTAACKPLERRGLLTISPDEKDRRGRRLTLTAAGREVLAAAAQVWRREHEALETALPNGMPTTLRAGLGALG